MLSGPIVFLYVIILILTVLLVCDAFQRHTRTHVLGRVRSRSVACRVESCLQHRLWTGRVSLVEPGFRLSARKRASADNDGSSSSGSDNEGENTILDMLLSSEHHEQSESYEYCRRTLRLPHKLSKSVSEFHDAYDDKMRYEQLLFMADHYEDKETKKDKKGWITDENKVAGCLSTVHIVGRKEKAATIGMEGYLLCVLLVRK
jgi:hypothetical protein